MNEWETCIAEWATRCHEKDATIAALQARVQELEEITKVICGHCCEPMEIPSKAVLQSQLTQRTAELERVRGLIKALPKVEGEIEVSSGVYNFILLKHDSGTRFLCGQIETEQTAKAIAALLQHRQGME